MDIIMKKQKMVLVLIVPVLILGMFLYYDEKIRDDNNGMDSTTCSFKTAQQNNRITQANLSKNLLVLETASSIYRFENNTEGYEFVEKIESPNVFTESIIVNDEIFVLLEKYCSDSIYKGSVTKNNPKINGESELLLDNPDTNSDSLYFINYEVSNNDKYLAYQTSDDLIWVIDLMDNKVVKRINSEITLGTEWDLNPYKFTPDSNNIVYKDADMLIVLNLEDDTEIEIGTENISYEQFSISNDLEKLVIWGEFTQGATVNLIDLKTSEVTNIPFRFTPKDVQFSVNGNYIGFVSSDIVDNIYVYDLQTSSLMDFGPGTSFEIDNNEENIYITNIDIPQDTSSLRIVGINDPRNVIAVINEMQLDLNNPEFRYYTAEDFTYSLSN